ncbi:MAG: ketol-acid reductoisomerase [Planctomycetaceae bacterium]|nr:ketol-acid reductoisomerase [Planctomycetaceae bacterium]
MAQQLKIYYDKDGSLDALKGKTVAVVGFGSQGHAHSQNLRDSGIKVVVSELPGTNNYRLAKEAGFEPISAEEATKVGDLIVITLPDEVQAIVYEKAIKPNLKPGKALGFCHGFNIRYGCIQAPEGVDVIMIAPKGPGHTVRSCFVEGSGVPCLIAIEKNATGKAFQTALAWGIGVGGGRAGIIETTFTEETETDLFGEQTVLCGGLTSLVKAGFETLTEAGYQPGIAYFEVLHELLLIIKLMAEGGMSYMRYSISNTAEWGDLHVGPQIVDARVKENMKKALKAIQDGSFAKEWLAECKAGKPNFKRMYEADKNHPIEVVGRQLRKMFSWMEAKEAPEE